MVNFSYSVLRSASLGICQFHVQITALERGESGLIHLEMIFGGHMMQILHRNVCNMLIMVVHLSTLHWEFFQNLFFEEDARRILAETRTGRNVMRFAEANDFFTKRGRHNVVYILVGHLITHHEQKNPTT
ncbi:uncharacterized protein [Apostichopus japonicus]|uniref:uncharacterized protein isoform X2 n=1 Tax=Stichopus japonicus TaxID=307972 RepID=UPI003AB17533